MIDYTIAEFLGIFLVGFPFFLFVIVLPFRGIFWIIEYFIEEPERFFLFHYHYRDKRTPHHIRNIKK